MVVVVLDWLDGCCHKQKVTTKFFFCGQPVGNQMIGVFAWKDNRQFRDWKARITPLKIKRVIVV